MPNGMCALVAAAVLIGTSLRADPSYAQAIGARADSDSVIALEHAWLDHEDSTTLERILAPDFVHALPSGEIIDKAEHVDYVAKHPRPASVHSRFERLDVRVYGSAAIATGIVDATRDGQPGVRRTVFTDVFVKRDGRWRAVRAQETNVVKH